MSILQNLMVLVGRICFSLIFIVAGLGKITAFSATAAQMTSVGIPYSDILLIIAIIFELGGGLLILLGWYARLGAFLIFLFIIPVTYFFHSYWAMEGAQAAAQMQHFLKNLTIWGASLYIMAFGAGSISLDYFRCKRSGKGRLES